MQRQFTLRIQFPDAATNTKVRLYSKGQTSDKFKFSFTSCLSAFFQFESMQLQ